MEVKIKLERVLQMLADVERVDALSDIERDMILADLREAYAAVKFAKTEEKEDAVTAPVVEQSAALVAAPEQQDEAEEDEPEMEFEIIFNEEENEEDEADEAPVAETPVVETPIFEQPEVEQSAAQPLFEQQVEQSAFVQHVEPQPIVPQPVPQYQAVEHQSVEMNNATNANPLASHISSFGSDSSRRSPILSLYEDAAPIAHAKSSSLLCRSRNLRMMVAYREHQLQPRRHRSYHRTTPVSAYIGPPYLSSCAMRIPEYSLPHL